MEFDGRQDRPAPLLGQTYLADRNADGDEARTLRPLQVAVITCRIGSGPRAGQKVLPLRGAMARELLHGVLAPNATLRSLVVPQWSPKDEQAPGVVASGAQ